MNSVKTASEEIYRISEKLGRCLKPKGIAAIIALHTGLPILQEKKSVWIRKDLIISGISGTGGCCYIDDEFN